MSKLKIKKNKQKKILYRTKTKKTQIYMIKNEQKNITKSKLQKIKICIE